MRDGEYVEEGRCSSKIHINEGKKTVFLIGDSIRIGYCEYAQRVRMSYTLTKTAETHSILMSVWKDGKIFLKILNVWMLFIGITGIGILPIGEATSGH